MGAAGEPFLPAARYAGRVVRPGSPTVQVRYRDGVFITPYGFPEWLLYGRAMVELPAAPAELSLDEVRVLDVLAANRVMAAAGDPLWAESAELTPAGWVWAHVAMARRVALVPAELHGAFRHLGGVATLKQRRGRRGLTIGDDHRPVRTWYEEQLAAETLTAVEAALGRPLPPVYRAFLARTNGVRPMGPAVHVGFGFVADQQLFGLGRADRHQDLVYANRWLADRFTGEFLAVGYVQGGMLAVRTGDTDRDSVWYWDDDDHRDDDDRYDADFICRRLLRRCADDVDALWAALTAPPPWLAERAAEDARSGRAYPVRPADLGASLPVRKRPPA